MAEVESVDGLALGLQVRLFLKQTGMDKATLAKLAYVSPSVIRKATRNPKWKPHAKTILKIGSVIYNTHERYTAMRTDAILTPLKEDGPEAHKLQDEIKMWMAAVDGREDVIRDKMVEWRRRMREARYKDWKAQNGNA